MRMLVTSLALPALLGACGGTVTQSTMAGSRIASPDICRQTPQAFPATIISESEAVAAARRAQRFDGVVTARLDHVGSFETAGGCGIGDGRAVWAVVVRGTFPPVSCGPAPPPPHPCPPPARTGVIFLDPATGALVQMQFPAPPRHR